MKENIAWRQFEAGRDYNNRLGLYDSITTCERFYRGDQWYNVSSGMLPTPVFNYIRRITDFLVSQIASINVDILFSDENLPFIKDEHHRERIYKAIELLNSNTAFRWEKCHIDRLIRNVLLDAAISGDGIFFTYWDPKIRTGQAYTGDFVTEPLDTSNIFVSNVNKADIQSQDYIIISGRESVEKLKKEASLNGAPYEDIQKIKPDGDIHYGAGDYSAYENTDASSEKATYIIKFTKNEDGYVHFEKCTKDCVIKSASTGLRLYPIAMFNWLPTKNSFHGTSPIKPLIQNQKYINKAYALLMKHMIDSAFSKVVYDKTRIPEWSNEVGEAIGVVGGELDGIAKTISPGEMDSKFDEIINGVIINTKESMGATEASLGEAPPTNTSAIVALQESNSVTLDSVKTALFTALEDLAAIWVDFMCAYYADGRMLIKKGNDAEALDCRLLREELISARVDVGAATRYSKATALSELTKLLEGGHITIKQYLERIPDGVMTNKEKLIEEINEVTPEKTSQ